MIRTFINRLLGKPAPARIAGKEARTRAAAAADPAARPAANPVEIPLGQRQEVPPGEHRIDPKLLDERAVRVVRTLKEAGHEAYIVGGAVRDLLVGVPPKDFDVATDATPEQVKALFRRAYIVGRRFRLVHVVFGRGQQHDVVEVSTFRAFLDASSAEQVQGNERTARQQISDKAHVVDASGRVLRDNVWGEQVEDAARRDFTINAMYYDPTTQVLVDYHHGLQDARARVLRIIGEPATRYREDPVRIVRVVRFAAKLGFALDPATQAPLRELSALLANVPASRLFDEMLKLLQTGHALRSLEELRRHGLDRGVFPLLEAVLHPRQPHPLRARFIELALADTDRRVKEGRAVAPSFMLACLLWHDVQARWAALREAGEAPFPALQQAIDAVFEARIGDVSGRGKLAADMREIWQMQPRFERRTAASAASLAAQPRFRAGYDFLRLRADVGEVDAALADWWEDYHLGDDEAREALVQALRPAASPRRVRKAATTAARNAVADPALAGSAPQAEAAAAGAAHDDDAPPPPAAGGPATPRRRRRRKPAAEGGAGGDHGDGDPGKPAAPD
jgi:poly(A) polymerase